MHGGNTLHTALPTSPDQFLKELKRRSNNYANKHPNDKDAMLTLKKTDPEYLHIMDALGPWIPDSGQVVKHPEEVKSELVKVALTSMNLLDALIGVRSPFR